MKKGIKKLTAILLAMMMGLSFTYTSYPVYAQENIETKGATSEQTESSVARVNVYDSDTDKHYTVYYDSLNEAIAEASKTNPTSQIYLLKDAIIYQRGLEIFNVELHLNGCTIYTDDNAELRIEGYVWGPGTINANIVTDNINFDEVITINGNITPTTEGKGYYFSVDYGTLRVNGNIGEFSEYDIEGAKVICTGTHPNHPSITSPLDGNELIKEPSNLQGFVGQKLSTVSLPQDWSWANGETELTSGTQTYTARFDTTNYETEYDFTNVEGYNKDQHYVERELTVNVGEAIAKVVKPDGTEVFYSDIVDAFAGAENSTLYLLNNVEYQPASDPERRVIRPANNMTLNTNGYMLTTSIISRRYNEGNPKFHIIGNGKNKTAVRITNSISCLTTTVSNAKMEVSSISDGSMYVKSDSSVVAINREDGTKPFIDGTATKLYLEEGADLKGEFRLALETNTIYTNVQPDKSKYKLEVPTTLELGKTYQLDLSEVFLNHSDIINKGKMDISISGMDKNGYITMKSTGNHTVYLPISIKDIDSLTNDTVILSAEHRNPEIDEVQHYNGNGQDSTSLTIGDKMFYIPDNPGESPTKAELNHELYSGSLTLKNNIDGTVNTINMIYDNRLENTDPLNVTGGVNSIKGTDARMEYATSETSDTWTTCDADNTKVEAGTYYVRYKETDTFKASKPVKVVVVAHEYKDTWVKDETSHWHECECGAKADEATHTFKWVIDKEATDKEKGSKHEECTVCGYKKASVEIPVLTPTNPEKPNTDKPNKPTVPNTSVNDKTPETGDQTNLYGFLALICMSGAGLVGTLLWKKYRKN